MINLDQIWYSLKNLANRKLRSFLSMLSILIGITSIFAIVSFGLGMQNYITDFAEEAGTNTMFIQSRGIGAPGLDNTFSFSRDEIDAIEKVNGVDEVVGLYVATPEIKFRNQLKYTLMIGFDAEKFDFIAKRFTIGIEKGRPFRKGELDKAVMGYNYLFDERVFSRALSLGDKIEINGNQYEVVGFFEEVGNPADDSQVYITEESMELKFPDNKDRYGFAIATSDKSQDVNTVAEKIEKRIRKYRNQDEGEEDFTVQTFEDAIEVYSSILGVVNGILALIAMVSLVVAAVNIMNTMYTAVIERTKEIGVMKAVGAKNSSILLVFVFESGLLGTVGGLLGVLLGYAIARIGGYAVKVAGYGFLSPVFPWYLTAGCLIFSFFVGSIAGLLPAIQAAKLQPVEALRYE